MTMLITEMSPLGIVMVSESAVASSQRAPFSDYVTHKVAYGARKIVPIPQLNCVIGVWGLAQIGPNLHSSDEWVEDFARSNPNISDIPTLAECLRDWLIDEGNLPNRAIGFHIAGRLAGGELTFWHVSDVDPMGVRTGIRAWELTSLDPRWGHRTPNGAIRLVNGVGYGTGMLKDLDEIVSRSAQLQVGLSKLTSCLQARAAYLRATVEFAIKLEQAAGVAPPTLGGAVACCTISPSGEVTYNPSYDNIRIVAPNPPATGDSAAGGESAGQSAVESTSQPASEVGS